MKQLPKELLYQTDFIALSTTLATNACVEGKGGRAKLIFIGMEPEDVAVHAPEYGLPGMDEIYCLPAKIPLEICLLYTSSSWVGAVSSNVSSHSA